MKTAPAFVRYVQGGCAIIKSHCLACLCFFPSLVLKMQQPFNNLVQSSIMCHSGAPPLHFCKSQENARCPNFLNSRHTACDSSHTIRTFKRLIVFLVFLLTCVRAYAPVRDFFVTCWFSIIIGASRLESGGGTIVPPFYSQEKFIAKC